MKYILITYILFHNLLLGPPPPPYLSNVTDILPSSPQNKSNPWSSVCVCRRLSGVGLALENGIYQVLLLCRKLTFPHPWQSSSNSSLVRNGTSCPFSPFRAGLLSGLSLDRSGAHCCDLWVCMCSSTPFPWINLPPLTLRLLLPLSHRDLWALMGWGDLPFRSP